MLLKMLMVNAVPVRQIRSSLALSRYIRRTNSLALNMSKSKMLIFMGVGTPVFSSKPGHCLDNEPAAILHF